MKSSDRTTDSKPQTRRVRWAGESVIWRMGDPMGSLTTARVRPVHVHRCGRGVIAAGAATYRCTHTDGAATTVPANATLYVALCTDALGSRLAFGPFTSTTAAADVVAGIPGLHVRGVAALHTGRAS